MSSSRHLLLSYFGHPVPPTCPIRLRKFSSLSVSQWLTHNSKFLKKKKKQKNKKSSAKFCTQALAFLSLQDSGPLRISLISNIFLGFSPRFSNCSWLEKLVLNKLINDCYNDMQFIIVLNLLIFYIGIYMYIYLLGIHT